MALRREISRPGAERRLKLLVFLMFAMFAMTTDSAGTIIPAILREFNLGMAAAGSFHYASMSGIGVAAVMLGFLADRIGHKQAILLGLSLFGVSAFLFAVGEDFFFFVALQFAAGLGIGIFKSGALALIGNISTSTRQHAAIMNLVEGFFSVGAIIGPALVTSLMGRGISWTGLYLVAGGLCVLLMVGVALTSFPAGNRRQEQSAELREILCLIGDRYVVFFGTLLALYVATETTIYVWAPTYFLGYHGTSARLAAYCVTLFFAFRAIGRFFGVWLLARFDWTVVLGLCSSAVALLFGASMIGGRGVAVYALPASGLFMSVLYPTINSMGISSFEKSRHGAIAGFLLFFTCLSAVLAPLAMGALGDWLGDIAYSMWLGALFALLLAAVCIWNFVFQPVAARIEQRNEADYDNKAATVLGQKSTF